MVGKKVARLSVGEGEEKEREDQKRVIRDSHATNDAFCGSERRA